MGKRGPKPEQGPLCLVCGKPVRLKRNKYCSRACMGKAIGFQAYLEDRVCLYCRKIFSPRENEQVYCSNRCAGLARHYPGEIGPHCKLVIADCSECGKPFVQRFGRVVCSRECSLVRGRRIWGERKEAIGRKQGRIQRMACQHCGREFEQVVYNQVKIYCSRKCARDAWRIANPEKATLMKAIGRHRRRARKMATLHVAIDPWAVYERDGWRCGICGRKVRRGLSFPHPMSASLDHIVPLASGGSHTWDNVQCAHFICNSRKGASEGGQLLLPVLSELT